MHQFMKILQQIVIYLETLEILPSIFKKYPPYYNREGILIYVQTAKQTNQQTQLCHVKQRLLQAVQPHQYEPIFVFGP